MPVLVLIHAEHKSLHKPRTAVVNIFRLNFLPSSRAPWRSFSKQVQITFICGVQSIAAPTAKMAIIGEK
jgi:hypothetical protein